jgi:hypothetical protein
MAPSAFGMMIRVSTRIHQLRSLRMNAEDDSEANERPSPPKCCAPRDAIGGIGFQILVSSVRFTPCPLFSLRITSGSCRSGPSGETFSSQFLVTPGAAVRSSGRWSATAMRSTTSAMLSAAVRFVASAAALGALERLGLLRVLALEGLHLIRVLTL